MTEIQNDPNILNDIMNNLALISDYIYFKTLASKDAGIRDSTTQAPIRNWVHVIISIVFGVLTLISITFILHKVSQTRRSTDLKLVYSPSSVQF